MGTLTPHIQDDTVAGTFGFPIVADREFGVSVIKFRDGSRQTHTYRATALRSWRLVWGTLDDTQYDSLLAFYDARTGEQDFWYWDNPATGETDIKSVFVGGTLRDTVIGVNHRSVSVEVQEIP